MLARALADLPPDRRRPLARGRAAATGAEARIAPRDVLRANPHEARATVADIVDALLDRPMPAEDEAALAPRPAHAQIR